MKDLLKNFKVKKINDLKEAQVKKNNSESDKLRWKKAVSDVKEIDAAIKSGVKDFNELMNAVNDAALKAEIKKVASEVKKQIEEDLEDPEFVFKKMKKYVNMVVKGINPSTIICGGPGVGKTYNVMKWLKANHYNEGHNLCTIRGKCSPRILYTTLYEYKGKNDIVVIDDADCLVGPNAPEDCINILKAALDSTGDDEGRIVNYGIAGKLMDEEGIPIPKKFHYNGGIIIITNYQAGSLDSSLRGRSFIQDIHFNKEQLLSLVKTLMPGIAPNRLSMKAKIKAYDYLCDLANLNSDMEISIRTFAICAKIFETVANDSEFTDDEAKKMIKEQMKLQSMRNGRMRKGKY